MEYLMVAGGLALLGAGGESLVRSAVALARKFGLPPLLIGVTVVAAATSAPELVVSVHAALAATPGIAVGNVVGSNIANLALGLGFMAMLAPFTVKRNALRRDVIALLVACAIFLIVTLTGRIGPVAGTLMVATLAAYLWWSYQLERRVRDAEALIDEAKPREFGAWWNTPLALAVLVLSSGALVLGAQLMLKGAVTIAEAWGVSDAIIGVTVVAIGTSLPEIATTSAAAMRRQHDVALGNLVGSSLFNLLAILGITSIVRPVPVETAFILTSGVAMLTLTLLVTPILLGRVHLGRTAGAVLVTGYIAYIALVTGAVALG